MDNLPGQNAGIRDALDIPILHDNDRYEHVKVIGSGNFGVAQLMRDKESKDLFAVKFIQRGEKVRSMQNGELFSFSTHAQPFPFPLASNVSLVEFSIGSLKIQHLELSVPWTLGMDFVGHSKWILSGVSTSMAILQCSQWSFFDFDISGCAKIIVLWFSWPCGVSIAILCDDHVTHDHLGVSDLYSSI
jgi:hypothetical protein